MKRVWNWLNGKKTALAAAYWALTATPIINELFDGEPPESVVKWVKVAGWLLTALGLGHKAAKGFKAD